MICPRPFSPPIFPPLPFLIQPHLPFCCYLHMPGTIPAQALCPYSTCRYPCGSYFLNPLRSLFLREASLNRPTKRSVPSHPPNYSESLYSASFLVAHITLQHIIWLICLLSIPPNIIWASWGQGLCFAHWKSLETIWYKQLNELVDKPFCIITFHGYSLNCM